MLDQIYESARDIVVPFASNLGVPRWNALFAPLEIYGRNKGVTPKDNMTKTYCNLAGDRGGYVTDGYILSVNHPLIANEIGETPRILKWIPGFEKRAQEILEDGLFAGVFNENGVPVRIATVDGALKGLNSPFTLATDIESFGGGIWDNNASKLVQLHVLPRDMLAMNGSLRSVEAFSEIMQRRKAK